VSIEKYGGKITNLLEEKYKDSHIFIRQKDGKEVKIGNFIIERRELRRDEKRRPDIVLWLDMNMRIFEDENRMRLPILIELESGGLDDAKIDFDTFFKEDKIETTGIVLGGNRAIRGWEHKTEDYTAKVILHIRQNPSIMKIREKFDERLMRSERVGNINAESEMEGSKKDRQTPNQKEDTGT